MTCDKSSMTSRCIALPHVLSVVEPMQIFEFLMRMPEFLHIYGALTFECTATHLYLCLYIIMLCTKFLIPSSHLNAAKQIPISMQRITFRFKEAPIEGCCPIMFPLHAISCSHMQLHYQYTTWSPPFSSPGTQFKFKSLLAV